MQIALIGRKYILKETLPKNIMNSYWICDKNKKINNKIIKIIVHNGEYKMINSEYSKILEYKDLEEINNSSMSYFTENTLDGVILKENGIYPINIYNSKEIYILCCLPDYEENFIHLDIKNISTGITIGSDNNNSIVYNNTLIPQIYAKIYKKNNNWTIENYDTEYGLFVNDFPVYNNTKRIFNGDIIFIMGVKIVIIKDTIYVSNPYIYCILNVQQSFT